MGRHCRIFRWRRAKSSGIDRLWYRLIDTLTVIQHRPCALIQQLFDYRPVGAVRVDRLLRHVFEFNMVCLRFFFKPLQVIIAFHENDRARWMISRQYNI